MPAGLRTVKIQFVGEQKGLDQVAAKGQATVGKWQSGFQKANDVAVKASAGIIVAAGAMGKQFIDAAEEGMAAERVLANVFSKMGGSGSRAFKQAADQAARLSKEIAIEDDEIVKVQAKLATFGNVWKDPVEGAKNFGRATKLAFDAAAVGFGSADSNAVSFGKALQDPIKGLAALARQGITFTDAEKGKIKALVESGKLLQAQEIILQSLEKQVGGSAAKNVTSAQRTQVAWENVKDSIGRLILPAWQAFSAVLQSVLGWVERNKTAAVAIGATLVGLAAFVLAANAAYKVYTAASRTASAAQWLFTRATGASSVATTANTVTKRASTAVTATNTAASNLNTAATVRGRIATWAATAATKAMSAAQAVLNAVMRANPLARVIALVVAIGAALVTAWNKSATFRRIATGAFRAVADAVGWVIDKVATLIGWVKDAIDWLGNLFSIHGSIPDMVAEVKAKTGRRAAGGPVHAGRTYLVGEKGPELVTMGGNGHVTPNSQIGGPSVLEAHIHIGDEVVRVVRTEIRGHDRGLRRRALAGAIA